MNLHVAAGTVSVTCHHDEVARDEVLWHSCRLIGKDLHAPEDSDGAAANLKCARTSWMG